MEQPHEPFLLVNRQLDPPFVWVTDLMVPHQQRLPKVERDRSVSVKFHKLPVVTIGVFRYIDKKGGLLTSVEVRGTRLRFHWEW